MDEKMDEELTFLVKKFKEDTGGYEQINVPDDTEEKRRVLRALMNVRRPKNLPDSVLEIQDEYLKNRAEEKGVVTLDEIPIIKDKISIYQGDITRLSVDAIVNAANSQMLGCFVPLHNCIDNCIHSFAGVQLRLECARKMNKLRDKYGENYEQPTAIPMLTNAYNLPSKKVIHIVGPIVYRHLTKKSEEELANCYKNTLNMCLKNNIKSVAFCCISTGVFNFPHELAAEIAVTAVNAWLQENPIHHENIDRIIFNVFKDEDLEIYEKLLG
ncbi:MAG: protein-ADP-ribose hydrolase [Lachnospiraceae bacterium]|nr:protein-ADP-ribose hydrolase [Lachnospiraceae bacterium]